MQEQQNGTHAGQFENKPKKSPDPGVLVLKYLRDIDVGLTMRALILRNIAIEIGE